MVALNCTGGAGALSALLSRLFATPSFFVTAAKAFVPVVVLLLAMAASSESKAWAIRLFPAVRGPDGNVASKAFDTTVQGAAHHARIVRQGRPDKWIERVREARFVQRRRDAAERLG